MTDPRAELYAHDLSAATWRKATASAGENNCVEVAELSGGARAVRDSKNPDREPLLFTTSEWTAFRTVVIAEEL
ncbi:DUF397 domain-containing protein [Streptomyces sp. NPDC050738]|uniref:DUF397 domain-containing protein n=1 Tax=Streptomyces sp. NPDC050738 TaxID=3154744 RepID=UPI003414A410